MLRGILAIAVGYVLYVVSGALFYSIAEEFVTDFTANPPQLSPMLIRLAIQILIFVIVGYVIALVKGIHFYIPVTLFSLFLIYGSVKLSERTDSWLSLIHI